MKNRLVHVYYPQNMPLYAVLETPCHPCSFYFGPVEYNPFEKIYETLDNATENWHYTVEEAYAAAQEYLNQEKVLV